MEWALILIKILAIIVPIIAGIIGYIFHTQKLRLDKIERRMNTIEEETKNLQIGEAVNKSEYRNITKLLNEVKAEINEIKKYMNKK